MSSITWGTSHRNTFTLIFDGNDFHKKIEKINAIEFFKLKLTKMQNDSHFSHRAFIIHEKWTTMKVFRGTLKRNKLWAEWNKQTEEGRIQKHFNHYQSPSANWVRLFLLTIF